MGGGSLPGIFCFLAFLFLLFFLAHPIQISSELSLGQTSGGFAFRLFHLFEVVFLVLFVVIFISLVLYGQQTGLVLLVDFLGYDLEIVLEEVYLFVSFDQSAKKRAVLDIRSRHFVDYFNGKKMVSFGLYHSFLFFNHIYIVLKGFDSCAFLIHMA
jgi:hypothetical protein